MTAITREELEAADGSNIIGFINQGSGAAQRTVQDKLREFISTADFGAAHDDATDDTAELQAALDHAGSMDATLIWSSGIARVSQPLVVPNNIRIIAQDETSGIRNVSTGANNVQAPLLIGNWHPDYLGTRANDAADWVDLKVTLHATTPGVSADDISVTLAPPASAANFAVGEVYFIISEGFAIHRDTGHQLRVPHHTTFVRVMAADSSTGVVSFDHPVGFDSATPVYLVKIIAGAVDSTNLPIYIARDVVIDGLKLYGYNAVGNNCAAMYNCRISNLGGKVVAPIQMGALVHSTIDGYRGEFTGDRLVEVKIGHHDGVIRNIEAFHTGAGPASDAMFSVGEYCRGLVVENFRVHAPLWSGGHLFQLQPGKDCVFRNGEVYAPSATTNPVYFYGDPVRAIESCGLENVSIIHGSSVHIVFDGPTTWSAMTGPQATVYAVGARVLNGGTEYVALVAHTANASFAVDLAAGRWRAEASHTPNKCFVRRSRFQTVSTATTIIAAAFNGGKLCEVTDNRFDKGKLNFAGSVAEGNLVRGNKTDTTTVDGSYVTQNNVEVNYKVEANDTLTEFGNNRSFGFKANGVYAGPAGAGVILDFTDSFGFLRARDAAGALQALTISGSAIDFGDDSGPQVRIQAGLMWARTAPVDIGLDTTGPFRNLSLSGVVKIGAVPVLGARKTGWSVATGTANRTAFDTVTVTTQELAQRVKALIDDLHSAAGHGVIGT